MNTTDHNTDAEHPRSPLPMVTIKLAPGRIAARRSSRSAGRLTRATTALFFDIAHATVARGGSLFWPPKEKFYCM